METTARFTVCDYDLSATLTSGQAFRWREVGGAWEGVIHGRWVRLRQINSSPSDGAAAEPFDVQGSTFDVRRCPLSTIEATTALPITDWQWLTDYLRLEDDLGAQLATFPNDAPMRAAVAHCHGLRLLRQEPWECLASFILSSTKQIVQIQQCIALLSERFGEPALTPPEVGRQFAFPSATRLAAATEAELRACKIGFRATYLQAAARMVTAGELDLARIPSLPLHTAREELMRIPGVGPKIADCALLFSCGIDAAFPIDVWVERALRQLYFPKRRVKRARIERFAATHFGPHAGLAQQYLFHYLRTGRDESIR
jgi:N-glycosylase/DNA lyase